MPNITKSLFLSSIQCPTFGYQQYYQPSPELSISDQLRIEEGNDIHNRAKALFPTGVLVSGD